MTALYVPGTEETDPKKQNMSLQLLGSAVTTNTANIAANTAAIAAIAVANKGYFSVDRNAVAGSGSAASYNKIQFTNEVVDSAGWFDSATNYRYTPLEAGYYFIVVAVNALGNTGGTSETCQAAIAKNGTITEQGLYLRISAEIYSSASGLVHCNGSTDYIEGQIYLPTGVTTYSGAVDRLYMFGWKVGS